jgi:hypothetical protein
VDLKFEELKPLLERDSEEPPAGAGPAVSPRKPAGKASKPPSLAEHVRTVSPSGGLEHVLAVGYYLERHTGLNGGFRRRDLAEAFASLRYRHSNPGVPIAAARRQGLLMDGREHEKVQLTETAERWVEDRLRA